MPFETHKKEDTRQIILIHFIFLSSVCVMAKEVVDNAESILTSKSSTTSSSSQLLHITEISLVYVQIC